MSQINSEVKAVFINGNPVPIKDGTWSAVMGGFTRTSVMGGQRRLGSSNAAAPGSCSFTVAYLKGTNIRGSYDVENAQIRVVFDRGDEWLMTGADLTEPIPVSAPEGDIELSYEGNAWEQTKIAS